MLRGPFRHALSTSLGFIFAAHTDADQQRAWKLWCLPGMLLHRQVGSRTLHKPIWRDRFAKFQDGQWQWTQLVHEARDSSAAAPAPPASQPSNEQRTTRARNLVHLGDLTAARQALLATPLAPGTSATLEQLRDPTRRPATPYQSMPAGISTFEPEQPLRLPRDLVIANLR